MFFILNDPMSQWIFLVIASLGLLLVGFGKISEWKLLACYFLASFLLPVEKQKILLSGFQSPGIHFIATILIIAALLQRTNLLSRLVLYLLIKISKRATPLDSFLFFIGIVITPFITSQSARLAIITPVLDTIISSSKVPPKSTTANAMASASFFGCILFSTIFLSGKSSNYLLLNLICNQPGNKNWFNWLYFASFPGLLLCIAFFVLQARIYKQNRVVQLNQISVFRAYLLLSAKSQKDKTSLFLISLLLLGLGLSFISHSTILLFDTCFFIIALGTRFIHPKELPQFINWNFLIYLAIIIGFMEFLSLIDLVPLTAQLKNYFPSLLMNSIFCIIFTFILSWLFSFLFGSLIAPGLVFTMLHPLLRDLHMNLWVISFVILMAAESWVFPYQSSYFLYFKKLSAANKNFALQPLLRTNCYVSLIKFLVLFASIPFWKLLELI